VSRRSAMRRPPRRAQPLPVGRHRRAGSWGVHGVPWPAQRWQIVFVERPDDRVLRGALRLAAADDRRAERPCRHVRERVRLRKPVHRSAFAPYAVGLPLVVLHGPVEFHYGVVRVLHHWERGLLSEVVGLRCSCCSLRLVTPGRILPGAIFRSRRGILSRRRRRSLAPALPRRTAPDSSRGGSRTNSARSPSGSAS